MTEFRDSLNHGRTAETAIAKWLIRRGHVVLPVYEIAEGQHKGPQVFSADGGMVAPDLLCITKGQTLFIEAKHKSVWTWHRITSVWCTGVDRHHYRQYLAVRDATGLAVWLLFFHRSPVPDSRDVPYCPPECPTGLFGGELAGLAEAVHHEHENWGRHGMVYWTAPPLRRLATVEEILPPQLELAMPLA